MNPSSGDVHSEPKIIVTNDEAAAIYDHLAAAYPLEGCGVLVGIKEQNAAQIIRAVGTRNADIQRATDKFTIEPLDLLGIERRLGAEWKGFRIVGFFHSHPDAPAQPSVTDLEMAQGLFEVTQEFYIYAIVSIDAGIPQEARYWQLSEDALKFRELKTIEYL